MENAQKFAEQTTDLCQLQEKEFQPTLSLPTTLMKRIS
jgi:hypothetical protein